jgi:hypothetical protein
MKKLLLAVSVVMILLSSCEVEYRGGDRYHHYWDMNMLITPIIMIYIITVINTMNMVVI